MREMIYVHCYGCQPPYRRNLSHVMITYCKLSFIFHIFLLPELKCISILYTKYCLENSFLFWFVSKDHNHRYTRGYAMQNAFIIIIIAIIVLLTNNFLTERRTSEQHSNLPEKKTVKAVTSAPPKYRCDGRIYCSQMTSCEEAMFFLRNCPGVKMDGDHDGIPCEEQCGH